MEITAAALAAELCGASQEDPLLAVLCEAAEAAWEKRLDPGVTKEDCGGVLRCAAAFMAAACVPRPGVEHVRMAFSILFHTVPGLCSVVAALSR